MRRVPRIPRNVRVKKSKSSSSKMMIDVSEMEEMSPSMMLMDVSSLGFSITEEDDDFDEEEEEEEERPSGRNSRRDSMPYVPRRRVSDETSQGQAQQEEWHNSRLSIAATADAVPSIPARRISDPASPLIVEKQRVSYNVSRRHEAQEADHSEWHNSCLSLDTVPFMPARRISDPHDNDSSSQAAGDVRSNGNAMTKKTSFGSDSSPMPPARRISDGTSSCSTEISRMPSTDDAKSPIVQLEQVPKPSCITNNRNDAIASGSDSTPAIPNRQISIPFTANYCLKQDEETTSCKQIIQEEAGKEPASSTTKDSMYLDQQRQQHMSLRRPPTLRKRVISDEVPCLVTFSPEAQAQQTCASGGPRAA